jgi:hypothetical protein
VKDIKGTNTMAKKQVKNITMMQKACYINVLAIFCLKVFLRLSLSTIEAFTASFCHINAEAFSMFSLF